jgi:hypothetical protein
LSDTQIARVTITYLSPELVAYIVLNDYLSKNDQSKTFDEELQNMLNEMGGRNELFFFVTIMAPNYNEKLTIVTC